MPATVPFALNTWTLGPFEPTTYTLPAGSTAMPRGWPNAPAPLPARLATFIWKTPTELYLTIWLAWVSATQTVVPDAAIDVGPLRIELHPRTGGQVLLKPVRKAP